MRKSISRNVSISRTFYNFIRPFLKVWFSLQFRLKVEIPSEVKELSPPFLLLPNHQGFWDPFMAGVYIRYPVFYIASDAIFRYPLLKFFMQLLGAIPKQKAQSDPGSIKNILRIRDAGGIIGVFPEGQRTWDGLTLPLVPSTAKLVKLLKIPVVIALFKGGYYSHPRWGIHLQKGEIELSYDSILSPEEIKKLTSDEIQKILTETLAFDESAYEEQKKQIFRGRKPAENLEQVLFMCPSCHQTGKLYSRGNTLTCMHCGYSVVYTKYRTFTSTTETTFFHTVRDWNRWQKDELEKYIKDKKMTEEVLFSYASLSVQSGHREKKMKNLFRGKGELTMTSIRLINNDGTVFKTFMINDIRGVNVQNKEKLDFYVNGILYNIFDKKRKFSAYSWLIAIQFIQQHQERDD